MLTRINTTHVTRIIARRMLSTVTAALLALCATTSFAEKVIIIDPPVEGGSNFSYELIKEIVKRKGGYRLEERKINGSARVSVDKTVADFEAGVISVMWTLSDRSWEEKYSAVLYPNYLGMFGLRLAIVKAENKHLLAGVQSLSDLQQFKAGQGRAWADTDILEGNNIEVVKVAKYVNHFPMLEGERFDFFPRAIHEPWAEVRKYSQYNLAVDENIVLRYKVPFYIFVLKENVELHKYLSEGMEELTQSGRHREMFFQQPDIREALQKSNLANRTMIELENPNLTKQTPLDRPELWFNPLADDIPQR